MGELQQRTDQDKLAKLSPHELQLIDQIGGLDENCKAIAGGLGLADSTFSAYRKNLMRKINVQTIQGIVRFAIRTGRVTA